MSTRKSKKIGGVSKTGTVLFTHAPQAGELAHIDDSDPNGRSPHEPGAKLDSGKPPVMRGAIMYFPRAIRAVALVSEAGAKKYVWNGWRTVPDGIQRYSDALGRHLLAESTDGMYDVGPEGTGCLHAAQVAWNALARLELILCEMERATPEDPYYLHGAAELQPIVEMAETQK